MRKFAFDFLQKSSSKNKRERHSKNVGAEKKAKQQNFVMDFKNFTYNRINVPKLPLNMFTEYFEVVKASLATYSTDCLEAVGRAFIQVEILTRHMIGQRNLDDKFK